MDCTSQSKFSLLKLAVYSLLVSVPVFNLRDYDFSSKDAFENIKPKSGSNIGVSLWPFRQPHKGSIVVVCYTVGQYTKPATISFSKKTTLNLNTLWIGMLKGDATRDK